MRHPRRHVAKGGDVTWRVRFRSGGRETSETFYSEADAVEFAGLLRAVGPARARAYIDQAAAEVRVPTIAELFEQWLVWKSARDARGNLLRVRSARTVETYRRQYERHVAPALGDKPASLVTEADVQEWVERLGGTHAPKTVLGLHALLHGVYTWALAPSRALVADDPCQSTELPKARRQQPRGLRPAEWHLLHQAARDVDPDAADLLLFLVSTGWRWSEAVALRAVDVDVMVDDTVHVTMGRVLRRQDGGRFEFVDDAKSEAGSRRIGLSATAAQMVLGRIVGRPPAALVFTTVRGGRWNYSYFHQRVWTRPPPGSHDPAPRRARILERARDLGLDRPGLTPHWLRHTQAGWMILAGEPLTAISRRLGHARTSTTSDVYGRMVQDVSERGLDALDAMLTPPDDAPRPELPDR